MAQPSSIVWQTSTLTVQLVVGSDEMVRIEQDPSSPKQGAVPLFGVRLNGDGNPSQKSAKALIGSYVSSRLKYQGHQEYGNDRVKSLDVTAFDETSQISVTAHLSVYSGIPVIRSTMTIHNESQKDIVVDQLSSFVVGALGGKPINCWLDYTLSTPTNTWFREAQWRDESLPNVGLDDIGLSELPESHDASLAVHAVSNRGTFSTGTYLPLGLLKKYDSSETWLWQIETNGSWRWELGDFQENVYLALGGPTNKDHGWKHCLAPSQSFTSVPVAICHVLGHPDSAFAALTEYRRRIRRPHKDNDELAIIFNDYMNCLMGDPTTEKVMALVDPAVKAGAKFFVIDCGWYADDNGWWDDVGLWEPSTKRFPGGLKALLDDIRAKGLIPGLWIEPEVIGVRSVVANMLPADAFFQENSRRIVEKGRYQLDYRHPEVIKRMDKVIDNLVRNYGVGYFKFDYNIEVVQGTDASSFSPADGQLGHNRAYLEWVGKLYDRFPDLIIESCSSGGQRMDYALLAIHSLQSTSDQQDPVRYSAIAAAVPTAVTPEQSASWAYPQPKWDNEKNAMTVVNSLLGRVHLSGRIDLLSSQQLELVASGMQVYKQIRSDLKTGLPFWPLGLPKWHDDWVALGIAASGGVRYVAVWRRSGSDTVSLHIPVLKDREVVVKLLYPEIFETHAQWHSDSGALSVRVPSVACARLFRLSVN
ncbi:Melibiase subfamily, putative [Talaromyces stipitatus ATCC 10500]|uniref:alpha-galactosidase n=1 Tax=Talaromyces stipitatus (strain ATCC 10500 / CBS 375.48 / QM 6759 / NRRL 1006) TaxID=441959 RepID=B8MJL7_TALSN|nr:Melibiase subfamily, putative [Talaromyces stipitatus ATCC 10500]EED15217.1 Melibiase subfamily, putative [Talaromyces stipitatus ATCC 10500]